MRPCEFDPDSARKRGVSHYSFGTPYVLDGSSDAAWEDYLQRVAAQFKTGLDAESYEQCMRGRDDSRRWIEYVVDGYSHPRKGNIVVVVGIPDLPHTLPHHLEHDEALELAIPPGASDGERLTILVKRAAAAAGDWRENFDKRESEQVAAVFDRVKQLGGRPELVATLLVPVLMFTGGPTKEPDGLARAETVGQGRLGRGWGETDGSNGLLEEQRRFGAG